MAKNNGSKTIFIVAAVMGVLLITSIIGGIALYRFNKINSAVNFSSTPAPTISSGQALSYQNARYGFYLGYPSNFSKQESQNGDGVTLTTNDPVMTVRVYGSTNALLQSLEDYLNWIRDNLSQESKNGEKAKEILKEEVPLGATKIPVEERQWTYIKSSDGALTLVDQVAFLKDGIFYNLQMEIAYSNYDEYVAHVFDDILASFKLK